MSDSCRMTWNWTHARTHDHHERRPDEINILTSFLIHISSDLWIFFISSIHTGLIFLPTMNNNVTDVEERLYSLSNCPTVRLLIKDWGGLFLKSFTVLEQNSSLKVLWVVNGSTLVKTETLWWDFFPYHGDKNSLWLTCKTHDSCVTTWKTINNAFYFPVTAPPGALHAS